MSNVFYLETPDEMLARIGDLTAELDQHRLKSGGGDGTSGGMSDDWKKSVEDRLVDLRTDMRELRDAAGDLKVDVATIKENMRHLPTKPWLFTTLAALTTTLIVLLTFIMAAIVRFLPAAH